MKTIKMIAKSEFATGMIINQVMSGDPKGMNLTQMRSRIRVLDALEAAKDADEMKLEDADFSTLKDALNGMPWGMANRDLLAVIDGILESR